MTDRRPSVRDQQGSILFSMIGALVIATLVTTLFAYTLTSIRQTSRDRDFQTSIIGADGGVQQALMRIQAQPDSAVSTLTGSSTVGTATYDWTATRVGNTWQVMSNGTTGDTSRVVEAEVVKQSRFLVGAFADVAFTMRGSNVASSYTSADPSSNGFNADGSQGTGQGSVGTNGTLFVNGGAFADQIHLYGTATCERAGCANADTDLIGHDTAFDIDAYTQDIQEEMDAACTSWTGWSSSSGEQLVGGRTYCFSSMYFDGSYELVDATSDDPVVVYVSGNVDTDNHVEINCTGCRADSTATPDSSALQIYSTGTQFNLGNHAYIAAAIGAPNASCQGSPSSAQAGVYGAMVCDDLSNQGSWNFYFDLRLLDLSNGQWDVTGWREEVGGSTSFVP